MSFGKTITLSNGVVVPQIGLGTWLSKPHEVENAVEIAVRNGYRHLDLARVYDNQHEVGAALKKVIPSVVKRDELFVTSKLWNNAHTRVEAALDETLEQLGLEYLDLYLIHWPVAFSHWPGSPLEPEDPENPNWRLIDREPSLVETWKAMIELLKTKKVRAIGVSNFTIKQIQGLIDATQVVPAVNQIEAHPLLPQDDLRAYCNEKNIHITAYSPLGNNLLNAPKLTDDPAVHAIAARLNATPAQVLVAWGVYRGYSVIPKSVQRERIISNFQQVELTEEDYNAISKIGEGRHTRFNTPFAYKAGRWPVNIFDEPAEKEAKYQVKMQ